MRASVPDSVDEIGIQAPLVKLEWVNSGTLVYLRSPRLELCKKSSYRLEPKSSKKKKKIDSIRVLFNNVLLALL